MNICLGSKNPVKFQAVQEVVNTFFHNTEISLTNTNADSLVSDQPIGLDQTIEGAVNRSKNAFHSGKYDLGFGIESGIAKDPTDESYYNLSVCAIYNGKNVFKGIGPGFKLPQNISNMLVIDKLELDEAVQKSGLTSNTRIGYHQGLIGILSDGKVTRMKYTKPAVEMALIAYINKI